MCCCHGGVFGCGGKGRFHLFGFLPWVGGVAISFGLGMLFVVVVVAGGCRFGFFFFIWVLIYIILLCKYIILMSRIEK